MQGLMWSSPMQHDDDCDADDDNDADDDYVGVDVDDDDDDDDDDGDHDPISPTPISPVDSSNNHSPMTRSSGVVVFLN